MILKIDKSNEETLHSQICDQVRRQILNGTLPENYRLPSTRQLKDQYGISRNVFLIAFEQLIAEGFLVTKHGDGTFVSRGIYRPVPDREADTPKAPLVTDQIGGIHFSVGVPDIDSFPLKDWAMAIRQGVMEFHGEDMGYSEPGGDRQLRSEIGKYVLRTKGIAVDPDQIFICAGSYQALILGILSAGKGRPVNSKLVIENPSYTAIARGASILGREIYAVPTDSSGLNPELVKNLKGVSTVCVTPSHLFPEGTVFPISRRIKLCTLAEERDFYIIENDYEGDLRLKGSPVPSLHYLNKDRVLHAGTLSQIFYPGIRTGYLIVPSEMIQQTRECCRLLGYEVPRSVQKGLALFFSQGKLQKHFKKMKKRYKEKQSLFLGILDDTFGKEITVSGIDAGLYLTVSFKGVEFDSRGAELLEKSGIVADYVYRHYWPYRSVSSDPGMILGYGNLDEDEMRRGMEQLKALLPELM